MKTSHFKPLALLAAFLLPLAGFAQVNSGSNGSDGAFNPTGNVTINMADHPTGIYQFTSVNIPAGVTVTFTPNANNKPVVWLVQGNCTINGTIDISGTSSNSGLGVPGGAGGYSGGNGGSAPGKGGGPGGGLAGVSDYSYASNASYGSLGSTSYGPGAGQAPGVVYGNTFILPLIGGSGGGGSVYGPAGGAGGGGAILIAASTQIQLNGTINARGGSGYYIYFGGIAGGCGSGGAVRLVSTTIVGTGSIVTDGGRTGSQNQGYGGSGRIRIDSFQNNFGGSISGVVTQGFQPIILPAAGQGIQLNIASVAGAAIPASPSGVLANPDVIIPAQQTNPIPIVVNCSNIPLNTEITVVVHPANGADVQAVGINSAGTLAASTATISLNMPRGGGIIYAKAVTGIAGTASATSPADSKTRSIAETGWTADGERFEKMEITATLGGQQQIAYITESGKRYAITGR